MYTCTCTHVCKIVTICIITITIIIIIIIIIIITNTSPSISSNVGHLFLRYSLEAMRKDEEERRRPSSSFSTILALNWGREGITLIAVSVGRIDVFSRPKTKAL